MSSIPCFKFKIIDQTQQALVYNWLHKPHVATWFYGKGLQNTLNHVDEFVHAAQVSNIHGSQYWLAYDNATPFAFLITSLIHKPGDELTSWCLENGQAMTLDMLIGDTNYLGQGIAHHVIQEFLLSQFSHVVEVLIDPEASNTRAVHVYEKAGFKIIGEFIPKHSPHPHYMMRLSMKALVDVSKKQRFPSHQERI